MAGSNDFLWFATGVGANVEPQSTYAADPAVIVGNSPGLARSAIFNKSWRQGTAAAALLGQFIANQNLNAVDDGNLTNLLNNYGTALGLYLASVTSANPNGVIRQRLQGSGSYYVNTSGSDANPGTSALPWQTLQHAANYFLSAVDFVGQVANVNCSGAFTAGINILGPFVGAAGPGSLNFNFQAGSSVTVSNAPAFIAGLGAQFTISGPVLIQSTTGAGTTFGAGTGVYANQGGLIALGAGGITYGACSVTQLEAVAGSIVVNASYNISGGATQHLFAGASGNFGFGSTVIGQPVIVVTLTGTPAFTYFANSQRNSDIEIASTNVSFVGSASAGTTRYLVGANGIINTAGGGASFLPGGTAGVVGSPPGLYL